MRPKLQELHRRFSRALLGVRRPDLEREHDIGAISQQSPLFNLPNELLIDILVSLDIKDLTCCARVGLTLCIAYRIRTHTHTH